MYVSHPVRRLCEDPIEGASVALVVELTPDADVERFEAEVDDLGGTVDEELPYDSWRVTVPQLAVADLCEADGFVRVETANTLSLGVDEDAPGDLDE